MLYIPFKVRKFSDLEKEPRKFANASRKVVRFQGECDC